MMTTYSPNGVAAIPWSAKTTMSTQPNWPRCSRPLSRACSCRSTLVICSPPCRPSQKNNTMRRLRTQNLLAWHRSIGQSSMGKERNSVKLGKSRYAPAGRRVRFRGRRDRARQSKRSRCWAAPRRAGRATGGPAGCGPGTAHRRRRGTSRSALAPGPSRRSPARSRWRSSYSERIEECFNALQKKKNKKTSATKLSLLSFLVENQTTRAHNQSSRPFFFAELESGHVSLASYWRSDKATQIRSPPVGFHR